MILAWSTDIDEYTTRAREMPGSPFEEIEYWRRRTAALTSVENQLKLKRARVVPLVLSKSPAGVVDLATRLKPGDSVVKSPIARTPSGRTI